MKNKSVELMVRGQYEIPVDVDVNVKFLAVIGIDDKLVYNFRVVWWEENCRYTLEVDLPGLPPISEISEEFLE